MGGKFRKFCGPNGLLDAFLSRPRKHVPHLGGSWDRMSLQRDAVDAYYDVAFQKHALIRRRLCIGYVVRIRFLKHFCSAANMYLSRNHKLDHVILRFQKSQDYPFVFERESAVTSVSRTHSPTAQHSISINHFSAHLFPQRQPMETSGVPRKNQLVRHQSSAGRCQPVPKMSP